MQFAFNALTFHRVIVIQRDITAQLIEPRRKRVTFLRVAIGTLSLQMRAEVKEEHIDPKAPRVLGAPFDVSMSRATWTPEEWLAIGQRLASSVLVFRTSTERSIEFAEWPRARHVPYTLPWSHTPRTIDFYVDPKHIAA